MKLIQTVMLRDEADVIDAQIAYHLNAGVDFVIAIDHDSRDGTTDILESYARDGYLHRIPMTGKMQESAWRTRMARLAATDFQADWVINTDADEFWMPRDGGPLKDVLSCMPPQVGVVWALTRHFPPRPETTPFFADRMTVRVSSEIPINDPASPYRPHAKVAHRADPDIIVRYGAHLAASRLKPLTDWYVSDVLHFPYRSLDQYLRKSVRRAYGDLPLGQYVKAARANEEGQVEAVFRAMIVDDMTLNRGRATGALVIDTRLRDALQGVDLRPSLADDPRTRRELEHIVGAAALREADTVRLSRRLDDLGARVSAVETGVSLPAVR